MVYTSTPSLAQNFGFLASWNAKNLKIGDEKLSDEITLPFLIINF